MKKLLLATVLCLVPFGTRAQAPVSLCVPGPSGCNPQGTYSVGGTIVAAATGTTGAVTATLAGVANKTTYICGFNASAIGGTAAISPITVSPLTGTVTFTYQQASSAGGATLQVLYNPCIPASAQNTGIAVATTADGTATAVDVNAWGFLQ